MNICYEEIFPCASFFFFSFISSLGALSLIDLFFDLGMLKAPS